MPKIYLSCLYKYDGKSRTELKSNQKRIKKKIISDFKNGIIKWERANCRCSSNNDLVIAMKDRLGFKLRIVLCQNCGLVRANPRISEKDIGIFYEKYYRELFSYGPNDMNEEEILSHTFKREKERGREILNFIKKNTLLTNGVVFDFGAGTGGMLKIFKDAGFETFGVDLNMNFLNFGVNQGLNLKKGSIDELKNYPKKADLIIASHILEHLHRIDDCLKKIRACLKNNGYFFIELPGIFNQRDFLEFFVIEHLYYFSLLTLKKVLGENGFHLIAGNEKIRGLFQKSSQKHNLRISKEDIKDILDYFRIGDIPLPINASNLIKNKKKLKNIIIMAVVTMLYKTRIINLLAFLKDIFLNLHLNKLFIFKVLFKQLFSYSSPELKK
ncbi:MAG: class I SAM-dependent methyltransferase [Promethearchaeota archaeon]